MFLLPSNPDEVIDVYRRAADENRHDALLRGATLYFPDYGQLVMTGDIHGHRRNFEKLVKFCVLGQSAARHVILHELIHQEPVRLNDIDLSHEVLFEAAHWKCAFPEQVHFLQSNHEMAQLVGHEITKNGRFVLQAFEDGVAHTFGRNHMPRIMDAIKDFISSFPLAARTPHGIFMSHSLPGPAEWPLFDPAVFERTINLEDFLETGPVYSLVWGRGQTTAELDDAALRLNAELFIVGHQPQETGFEVVGQRMLILASDHNHGVFLPINLSRKYTMPELVKSIRPYVSVP